VKPPAGPPWSVTDGQHQRAKQDWPRTLCVGEPVIVGRVIRTAASLTLVDPGGDVAGRCAEADIENQHAGHQRAAIGWRQEPKTRKHYV